MRTIKPKVGTCKDCTDGKDKPLTAGRCEYHYKKFRHEASAWKRQKRGEMEAFLGRKPIPKVSQRQLGRLKDYRKVRDEFMAAHTVCQARLTGCTVKSTDLHHARGKIGELLTDTRYFKALCRSCHTYIETHPEFARKRGLSSSRLN